MNYGEIKNFDIANGEGVRVSLFVSGCTHHCKNCFNRETWDFSFGKPFTAETEALLLKELAPDYINGLSLLGGEPFEPQNQAALLPFLRRVKAKFPKRPSGATRAICSTRSCSPTAAHAAPRPTRCSR